jgi:hypothetical protein
MKRIIYFWITVLIFIGCKKDGGGNLTVTMRYVLSDHQKSASVKSAVKSYSSTQEEQYTQFGDYITSITPSVYIIKFGDMRFQNYDKEGQMWNNSINIINSNMTNTDEARFADFTKNNIVNITPVADHYDTRNSVTLNIFVFITMFIYQEFELPSQYANVKDLENLVYEKAAWGIDYKTSVEIGGERDGLTIKGSEMPLIKDKLFDNDMPHSYVFGATDSTYIWKNTLGGQSINDPIGQGGYIVRSNKYNSFTIPAISKNETYTLAGTMSFNINNIIQVYAGADNIPYTSDDIFVYAPKYWERLSVSLDSN